MEDNTLHSDSAERPNIINKSGKSSKTSASSNSKSGKSSEHESNKKQQKTDQIGAGPSSCSSKSPSTALVKVTSKLDLIKSMKNQVPKTSSKD